MAVEIFHDQVSTKECVGCGDRTRGHLHAKRIRFQSSYRTWSRMLFILNFSRLDKSPTLEHACEVAVKTLQNYMDRVKRIWYLSPMRAAKVQASLRISAVSPEPPLLPHTSSESRGTSRQKARSLAPLNGWACAVKICNDGMLEDTNSLDGAHIQ